MSLAGKKIKRTGEAYLFNEQTGKLTEDALATCKICGVDPKDLYPKSVEAFLKQGFPNEEAQKRKMVHEEMRQENVALVLKHISLNNNRGQARKANSVLNNLALNHEDRILRSAYKQAGKAAYLQNTLNGNQVRKAGQSMTPYKTGGGPIRGRYETSGYNSSGAGVGLHSSGHHSPDDLERKYEKNQKRWEQVMQKKTTNTDQKNKDMKKVLAKKFKREIAMAEFSKQNEELKNYNIEERKEKFAEHVKRKHDQDERIDIKKRKELKESMRKQALVDKRRQDLLQERRQIHSMVAEGGIDGGRNLAATQKENSSQVGGNASTHQLHYATMGGRARSSTGRKQLEILEESEEINNRLAHFEEKMQRANEKRNTNVANKINSVKDFSSKVNDCLTIKYEKMEKLYMDQFESNTVKRYEKMKNVKKMEENNNDLREHDHEQKAEKWQAFKSRVAASKYELEKKNAQSNKKWERKKNPPPSQAQLALIESQQARMEMSSRRQQIQQMNLARRKRINQEYKQLLVDKLQYKESRVEALHTRKEAAIQYSQRLNSTLQDQFFKTSAATASAIQPQPYENHKAEFKNSKEAKPVVKEDD